MSKVSATRSHPWKEPDKCAGTGSVKALPRSTSKSDSMQLTIDKIRGLKRDGLSHLKLFVKPRSGGKREDSLSNSTPSPEVESVDNSPGGTEPNSSSFRQKLVDINDGQRWTLIQTRGTKPIARYNHAAAVVGRKLLVMGGETGVATRNDVQMLHLGKLSWSKIGVGDSAPSKGLPLKTGPAQELPNCKGHSLITWGKTVILVGGIMDPPADKVTVWSFDLEMDSWTTVVTKGEIPCARRGQSVTRAGSLLVMLGGEDWKGRKLNDLHILDLKSLMWLPLHASGRGPSPRARHVAEMYDDRFLVVFGGETRSKISNDIYALDFDNMEWSKLKLKGIPPAPRAGHAGALIGSKWYIAGGESRMPGLLDTVVLDFLRMEWKVVAPASTDSVAAFQGMSLSFVERKDKKFLVSFGGGSGNQASNAVHVLHIPPEEPARMTLAGLLELPTTPDLQVSAHNSQFLRSQSGPIPSFLGSSIPCACVSVKTDLGPVVDQHSISQRSSSKSVSEYSMDFDRDSGLIPLRMRYATASQNSHSQRMEPLARRSSAQISKLDTSGRRRLSKDSNWDPFSSSSRRRDLVLPKLKDPKPAMARSEVSVRQHQSAQRIDWQSTEITAPPSVDSGLLCAEELQITAPSVHPGLVSSVGDAGTLLSQTGANSPRGRRSYKGGSQSSEFSGYAETFVSGNGEEHNNTEPSLNDSIHSVESNMNLRASSIGCPSPESSNRTISYYTEDELHRSSNGTVSDYAEDNRLSTEKYSDDEEEEAVPVSETTYPVVEEDELVVLSKLEEADDALERSMAISKLKEYHERKLAAAIRTGELLAGQFAEALRNRDEAERILQTVNDSRQHAEGRLALALKQIKDLQERLSVTELAREESNSLIQNARVEKMKLEHDLALKTAVLGESQKELQAARGVLIAEGTRAFQLQVELLDVKHKLKSLNSRGLPPNCQMQQSILA